MYRRFITLVVSASLAVTSITVQPAQAGDDDVAKWIAGLAAVAIIGAAINDRNDNRSKPSHNSGQVYQPKPQQGWNNQGHSGNYVNNHGVSPRPNPYALPAKCRVTKKLRGQQVRGFTRGCLKRNNVNVRALPRECAIKIRDRKRDRNITMFTGRCLRGYGYRLARH